MNDAYVNGFIEKCAELGVDPEYLLKLAFVPPPASREAIIRSISGLFNIRGSIPPKQIRSELGRFYKMTRSLPHAYPKETHRQWNTLAANFGIPEVSYARLGNKPIPTDIVR